MKNADIGKVEAYTLIFDQLRKNHASARRAVLGKRLTFTAAGILARRTAEVRMLLSEWLSAGGKQGLDKIMMDEVMKMREQYLELEGMIKEERNNLEPPRKPA
jgi:hypothetical protein